MDDTALLVDDRTIGRRLQLIRRSRGKSLQVIAELASFSKSHLSRLESGERALDRRSLIVALTATLDVAPTDLIEIAMPARGPPTEPGPVVDRVRIVLLSVSVRAPADEVMLLNVLRARTAELLDHQQACRHEAVGTALPDLIRDLHTTMATGHDGPTVTELAVLLHVQGTQEWLRDVGAPLDLGRQATMTAQQEAQRIDNPTLLRLARSGLSTACRQPVRSTSPRDR